MRHKITIFTVSAVVLIFLPVAVIGLMLSINEYRAQGLSGTVDCNGPYTVMLFIVPSLVVYAAGAVYYAALMKGSRLRLPATALMILCSVMLFASGSKAWAAYSEKIRPEHQETCGTGW